MQVMSGLFWLAGQKGRWRTDGSGVDLHRGEEVGEEGFYAACLLALLLDDGARER